MPGWVVATIPVGTPLGLACADEYVVWTAHSRDCAEPEAAHEPNTLLTWGSRSRLGPGDGDRAMHAQAVDARLSHVALGVAHGTVFGSSPSPCEWGDMGASRVLTALSPIRMPNTVSFRQVACGLMFYVWQLFGACRR